MSKREELPMTTFYCRTCNEFQTVYALGTVIQGPFCPSCHKPMKKITIRQTELDLFSAEKGKRLSKTP